MPQDLIDEPVPTTVREPGPGDRREQRGWYFYDWANSAFSTTVAAVFLGPYVSDLALKAVGADGMARVLGIPVAPHSFVFYCSTISVILQVLFLPLLGAIADYSNLRKKLMQIFAVAGSVATMLMFFVTPDTWKFGGLLFILANLAFGAAIVFYNAFLPDIAEPDDRDRVSSVGWAMGYLGGGILLVLNLILYQMRERIGIDTELAVRINLFSGGLWWFSWSFVTWRLLRSRDTGGALPAGENYLSTGIKQLVETFREAARYPHTIRFLIAYLLYNDGIQTVFTAAAIFATAPIVNGGLEIDQGTLTMIILMIQFVAFAGALLFGRVATRIGTKKALLIGLVVWTIVVIYAYLGLRGESRVMEFWILAACIALVMGGYAGREPKPVRQHDPTGQGGGVLLDLRSERAWDVVAGAAYFWLGQPSNRQPAARDDLNRFFLCRWDCYSTAGGRGAGNR